MDAYLHGHELATQKAQAGPRLVATLYYNAWFTNDDPKRGPLRPALSEKEFLPLPLLDGPPPPKPVLTETPAQFRARLEAQNKQVLAQRAQPSV